MRIIEYLNATETFILFIYAERSEGRIIKANLDLQGGFEVL